MAKQQTEFTICYTGKPNGSWWNAEVWPTDGWPPGQKDMKFEILIEIEWVLLSFCLRDIVHSSRKSISHQEPSFESWKEKPKIAQNSVK